ncbi:uncharacterized protein TRAVEDRAFT_128848, partial [Trametes versicolor FP-101664 SS1]|uniref:uncharacterized protein n=1 Tax=Trametes versicolor (strain FP-101664) TaxID=717944 RepID=UPI0004621F08
MSASSSPSLGDFINGVEKLDSKGKNWIVFEQQFTVAARQKEVWDHFTGKSTRPTPDEAKPPVVDEAAVAAWEKKENLALYLLMLKIAPVTYAKHKRKGTVAKIWAAIVAEFSSKSLLARSNL